MFNVKVVIKIKIANFFDKKIYLLFYLILCII